MPTFGGAPKCGTCGKSVYFAEEVKAVGKSWHKMCFKCSACNKMLDSTSVTEHEHTLYCRSCHGKNFGPSGYGFAAGGAGLSSNAGGPVKPVFTGGATVGGTVDFNSTTACRRCGKQVYFAEEVVAMGRKWHKQCFSCATCRKKLDSSSACDHEGELYCKTCYGREFGPKGVGYGLGAGTLQTT